MSKSDATGDFTSPAFKEGVQARKDGIPVSANPYWEESPQYNEWEEGWEWESES